jgi:lipoprotein-releasing system ATP-binding protein
MNIPVLRLENIGKSFHKEDAEIRLFDNLSVAFAPGETVAITGSSGCGKSTLMFLMAGLDTPDHGNVYWSGTDVFSLSENDRSLLRGRTLGFVFQFHHLLPEFTALENVMMPALIQGKSFAEAREMAEPLMENLGVHNRRSHRPSELSGGEQQRIAFARALVNRPPVILADEPTGNLDGHNAAKLLDVMHAVVSDSGVTFILVTHDQSVASTCKTQYRLSTEGLIPSIKA